MDRESGGISTTVVRSRLRGSERIVRADYWGGPYIGLTFGSARYQPTEVINVWDYAKGEPEMDSARQWREAVEALERFDRRHRERPEVFGLPDKAARLRLVAERDRAARKMRADVRREVQAWIKANDIEWPEWYEGYLENARYA